MNFKLICLLVVLSVAVSEAQRGQGFGRGGGFGPPGGMGPRGGGGPMNRFFEDDDYDRFDRPRHHRRRHFKRYAEWYAASGAEDKCDSPPSDINTGDFELACEGGSSGDVRYICVSLPRRPGFEDEPTDEEKKFKLLTGECKDPCALKFRPDFRASIGDEAEEEDDEDKFFNQLL